MKTKSNEGTPLIWSGTIRRHGPGTNYLIALLAVVLPTLLNLLLKSWLEGAFFAFPITAVLLTALLTDLGPTLMAIVLNALCSMYFFLPPTHSFAITGPGGWLKLLILVGLATLVARIAFSLKEAFANAETIRNRYERLVNLVDGLIAWEQDPKSGEYLFVSGGTERLLNYSKDRWYREADFLLNHTFPEDRAKLSDCIQKVLQFKSQHKCEIRLVAADGKTVWTSTSVRWDEGGGKPRVLGMTFDVHTLKQAEQSAYEAQKRLLKSEETLRLLAEAGIILSSSLNMQEVLTRATQLAVPRLAAGCMIDLLEQDQRTRLAAAACADANCNATLDRHAKAPAREQPKLLHGITHVLLTMKSEIFPSPDAPLQPEAKLQEDHPEILRALQVSSYICIPLQSRSRLIGVITFFQISPEARYSYSDLARLEEFSRRVGAAIDNAELYQNSQRAINAREEVLGTVSHDLRTPLTGKIANAELISRFSKPDEKGFPHRQAEIIAQAGKRMNMLIEDLLLISRLEQGRFSVERSPHSVKDLLNETLSQFEFILKDKALSVQKILRPEELSVNCDKRRILQALTNLIGNAIKFSPAQKTIIVGAELSDESETRLWVSDQGPGIAPEFMPHLFERFWQAPASKRLGSGLGLAITKEIVAAHGGRIWAESQPGKGSTFYFTIPAAQRTIETPPLPGAAA